MNRPAWRIALIAGKGGVGKTTTTLNIAAALAERGLRCLVVDCDPQSNLTSALGLDPYASRATVADVMWRRAQANEAITATSYDNLDVMPAHPDMWLVEAQLAPSLDRELNLRDALNDGGVADRYEVIMFDCPTSFGLYTMSALAASQHVLIPLQMSGFAFRGLKEVLRAVATVQNRLNHDLQVLGAVPTFVNRTRFSREMLDVLSSVAPVRAFRTAISQTVKLQETSLVCEPVTSYATSSRAAEEYRSLAAELIAVLEEKSESDVAGDGAPVLEVVSVSSVDGETTPHANGARPLENGHDIAAVSVAFDEHNGELSPVEAEPEPPAAESRGTEDEPVTTEPEPPAAESGGTEGEPEATSVGDDSGSSRPQRSFVRRIFRRRQ